MKFIPLHRKNTAIVYKNSLCSTASLIVFVFIVLSVMIPVLLVSLLSPYSGISKNRILYEQPRVMYTFQYLFLGHMGGEDEGNQVACSTFPYFNRRTQSWQKNCDSAKFSSQDHNYDSQMDRANFQLQFDALGEKIQSFELIMIFEATLRHKCKLRPPAVLIHHLDIPRGGLLNGVITLKGNLELTQNSEFVCPFYGRNVKTHFQREILPGNTSNMDQFNIESIQERIKVNPAFFELEISETYYKQTKAKGLKIYLQVDIGQVAARYHLNPWESLGQFWLYFASFFGISFYVMDKAKDFLFGKRIIRCWEVIPWKKLY